MKWRWCFELQILEKDVPFIVMSSKVFGCCIGRPQSSVCGVHALEIVHSICVLIIY